MFWSILLFHCDYRPPLSSIFVCKHLQHCCDHLPEAYLRLITGLCPDPVSAPNTLLLDSREGSLGKEKRGVKEGHPQFLRCGCAPAAYCSFADCNCGQQFRAKSRAPCVDSLSQFSVESTTSADSREPQFVAAGDIRKRLSDSIAMPKKKFNVSQVSALPFANYVPM